MGSERASVFEEEDLDISGFAPKAAEPPAPHLEKIRAVSEGASFRSREPRAVAPPAARPGSNGGPATTTTTSSVGAAARSPTSTA